MPKGNNTDVEVLEPVQDITSFKPNNRQQTVAGVTTLSDLRSLFDDRIKSWDEIEPSFDIFEKDTLVGVPFVIGAVRLNESKTFGKRNEHGVIIPAEFVSMLIATVNEDETLNAWGILNDGSTGIREQISRYIDNSFDGEWNKFTSIWVKKGLRRSDYNYENPDSGEIIPATTYYLT